MMKYPKLRQVYQRTDHFLKAGRWMVNFVDLERIRREHRALESVLWFVAGLLIGVLTMTALLRFL